MLTGSVLIVYLEKVLVHLRDGRKLIGVLRSYDQYGEYPNPLNPAPISWPVVHTILTLLDLFALANLVLTMTVERIFHPRTKAFAEQDQGVFLVRGENVVLLGEIVSTITTSTPLLSIHFTRKLIVGMPCRTWTWRMPRSRRSPRCRGTRSRP